VLAASASRLGQELLEGDDQRQDQRYFADYQRFSGQKKQQAESQRYDHHRLHGTHGHHHSHGFLHFSTTFANIHREISLVNRNIITYISRQIV